MSDEFQYDESFFEADSTEENDIDVEGTLGLPPGYDEIPRYSLVRSIAFVVLAILVVACILWLLGRWQRGQLPKPWEQEVIVPSASIVESQEDTVLLLEGGGEFSRVILQKEGIPGWILVSMDDLNAKKPALSSDGEWVAYLSTGENSHLVITSIDNNTRQVIDDEAVETAGDAVKLRKMNICVWSPIAWMPGGNTQIAFYACQDKHMSVIVIADLTVQPVTLTYLEESLLEDGGERQLAWLGTSEIFASIPPITNGQPIRWKRYPAGLVVSP